MGKTFLKETTRLLQAKRQRKRWKRTVISLSLVVAMVTSSLLSHPAITMERTASCGISEHTHDQSCYQRQLICQQEEINSVPATEEKLLSCQLTVHEHTDECKDENGELICGIEAHTHEDGCYQIITTPAVEGHTHSDACYEDVLICQQTVHVHSDSCFETEAAPAETTPETAAPATEAEKTETEAAETEKKENKKNDKKKETDKQTDSEETSAEEAWEAQVLTVTEKEYTITVEAAAEAKIPQGAGLKVRELKEETDLQEYTTYAQQAAAKVQQQLAKEILYGQYFDLTIEAEGKEIQPAVPVKVKITYTKAIENPEGSEIKAIAFGDTLEILNPLRTNLNNSVWSEAEFEVKTMNVLVLGGIGTAQTMTEAPKTEAVTESETEAATEAETEAATELHTEGETVVPSTEIELEPSEVETEEITEAVSEAEIESETETEPATEAVTETFTETEIEEMTEADTEEASEIESESESEVVTEEATEQEAESETETERYMEGVQDVFTDSAIVTVIYDEAAKLPEGSILKAKEYAKGTETYQEYLNRSENELGYEASNGTILDIYFEKDGKKVEPQANVTVMITLSGDAAAVSGSTVEIVHFKGEEETPEIITDIERSNGGDEIAAFSMEQPQIYSLSEEGQSTSTTLTFQTDSFSIYAIIEKENEESVARARIYFQNADGTPYEFINNVGQMVDNQILHTGSFLEEVGVPVVDVNDQTFQGWYIYDVANSNWTSYKLNFGEKNTWTVDYGTTKAITSNTAVVTSEDASDDGCIFYARPYYGEVKYLTFYDDCEGKLILNRVQVPVGTTYDISTQKATPPDAVYNEDTGEYETLSYVFTGWSNKAGDYNDNRTAITDTVVTVNEDLTYYPIFSAGHWVSFVSAPAGSGATYIQSKLVPLNKTSAVAKPDTNPTWKGHTFVGWFTEPEAYEPENENYTNENGTVNTTYNGYLSTNESSSGAYAFNEKLTEDLTLYAHWNAGTAHVTVIKWLQVVTDNKNATNPSKEQIQKNEASYKNDTTLKHYEYGGQENVTKTVNGLLQNTDISITGRTGFSVNTTLSDANVVVKDDGTAVLNLYYDRNLITMTFDTDVTKNGAVNTYIPTTENNGTQYGLVDGQYVKLTLKGTWPKKWYYNNTEYTGTRYTKAYGMTGLYGQTLAQNGYSWPGDVGWQYTGTSDIYYMSYLGQFVLPANRITGANDTVKAINFKQSDGGKTIYYYLQNADGSWPNAPTAEGNTNASSFQIAEKFDGFIAYKYQENHNGSGVKDLETKWTNAKDSQGNPVTISSLKTNTAICFKRIEYTIKFLDSNDGSELTAAGNGITTNVANAKVRYGASIEAAQPKAGTYVTNSAPQYEWDGKWYENQACTIEFDFTKTMPNHDVAVYAGWKEVWYWVKIDPNGGQLDGTEYTWFWEAYGSKIEEYRDITRNYVEDANGDYYYHYDEFDPTTEMNQYGNDTSRKGEYRLISSVENWEADSYDGKRYKLDTENTYTFVGWYKVNADESLTPYSFDDVITANLTLKALWRKSGQYKVKYSTKGVTSTGEPYIKDGSQVTGSNAPIDGSKYADKSGSFMLSAPTNPAGTYSFAGWYYNGKVYNPGDAFIVDADLAVEDEESGKVDTIWIYPVFLSAEDVPVETTSIRYVGNGGTADQYGSLISSENGTVLTQEAIQVNEKVDISTSNQYFSRPGYTFVGWGKRTQGSTTTANNFLEYKDGIFYLTGTKTKVLGIAADDLNPDEELYALWEVETYSVTVQKVVKSDIAGDSKKVFTFVPSSTLSQDSFLLSGENWTDTYTDEGGNSQSVAYTTSKEFIEIPYGTKISVKENDTGEFIASVVYTVTGADDTADNVTDAASVNGAELTVKGNMVITFTNTRKTAEITLVKTDDSGKQLSGAEFTLSKLQDGSFAKIAEYTVGTQTISNLAAGVYQLTETKAPTGYIISDANVYFVVDTSGATPTIQLCDQKGNTGDSAATNKSAAVSGTTITVTNKAGVALPNTGGSGTSHYTLSGLMLIAAALMYGFVLRRRRERRVCG